MAAEGSNSWLGMEDLEKLDKSYPRIRDYCFVQEAVTNRGKERADDLIQMISGHDFPQEKSLELGALDGQVSHHLAHKGFEAFAVDLDESHFSEMIDPPTAQFIRMDAANLEFPDDSFSLVFSYNSFEHFADPVKVLDEAIRVLRPDGYLYFKFGPLYPSPLGLHAYESIGIPYLQFLFQREMLEEYCEKNKRGTIEFDSMNGISASRFREIFESHGKSLEKIFYREMLDTYGRELILRYPQCFKGKIDAPRDLFISTIEGLFRKRESPSC